MLIFLKHDGPPDATDRVVSIVRAAGAEATPVQVGDVRAVLAPGASDPALARLLESVDGVDRLLGAEDPMPRVRSGAADGAARIVSVGDRRIGDGHFALIAGPCAVESESQLMETARGVASAGADLLRGGAYKPRTSPYAFQGLGVEGLRLLRTAGRETGLPVVTEAVDEASLAEVEAHAEMIQIGSRNMQNFQLLRRAGRSSRPVLLKRGMSASLEEWLLAAEYLLDAGSPGVVLCERGIRTFSNHSRFTLDLSVVPMVKRLTALPVVVDPSHATGRRESVVPLALAARAAGADGVMVEVHADPAQALCDGAQSISLSTFAGLAGSLSALGEALHRTGEAVG